MPVSLTVTTASCPSRRASTVIVLPPSEYFTALLMRWPNSCARRAGSPSTTMGSCGAETLTRSFCGAGEDKGVVQRALQHGIELGRFAVQFHAAAGDARHLGEVVDQVLEVAELALHDLHGGARGLAELHHFQGRAHGGKRAAQLPRERREEFADKRVLVVAAG